MIIQRVKLKLPDLYAIPPPTTKGTKVAERLYGLVIFIAVLIFIVVDLLCAS